MGIIAVFLILPWLGGEGLSQKRKEEDPYLFIFGFSHRPV